MSTTDATKNGHPPNSTKNTKLQVPFWERRQDVILWSLGIVFIVILLGTMFGLGILRGWDAQSGYYHNDSITSQERFLPEPFIPEPGVKGRYGVDATSRWYYWKLPPNQASAFTRTLVWLCYSCHQVLMWGCIYYGQKRKMNFESGRGPRYSGKLETFNYFALALNAVFHLLHLGQTHWTYDAGAQDTSVASPQSAFIMLIVLVLVLEYRDRGIAFGWPTARNTDKVSKGLRFPQTTVNLVRKYHGYAFAWAAIYTFWYHPMENTWGHALGLTHTFLLMLQGSLIYTDMHLNRYWRLTLEAWVIMHGALVAAQTGNPTPGGFLLWPMFCFGFLWLFTMTQLFGLPFWKKLPWWTRFLPFLAYIGVVAAVYLTVLDDNRNDWTEIIRIPMIEYPAAIFAWILIELFVFIEKKIQSRAATKPEPLSPAWEALYIMAVILVFACMVTVGSLVHVLDWKINLITLMVILLFVFISGTSVSIMLLKQCFRKPGRKAIITPVEVELAGIDLNRVVVDDEKKEIKSGDTTNLQPDN